MNAWSMTWKAEEVRRAARRFKQVNGKWLAQGMKSQKAGQVSRLAVGTAANELVHATVIAAREYLGENEEEK